MEQYYSFKSDYLNHNEDNSSAKSKNLRYTNAIGDSDTPPDHCTITAAPVPLPYADVVDTTSSTKASLTAQTPSAAVLNHYSTAPTNKHAESLSCSPTCSRSQLMPGLNHPGLETHPPATISRQRHGRVDTANDRTKNYLNSPRQHTPQYASDSQLPYHASQSVSSQARCVLPHNLSTKYLLNPTPSRMSSDVTVPNSRDNSLDEVDMLTRLALGTEDEDNRSESGSLHIQCALSSLTLPTRESTYVSQSHITTRKVDWCAPPMSNTHCQDSTVASAEYSRVERTGCEERPTIKRPAAYRPPSMYGEDS